MRDVPAVEAVPLRLLYAEARLLYAFGFSAKDWEGDMVEGCALCRISAMWKMRKL